VLVPVCTPGAACPFDLAVTMSSTAGANVVIDVTGYLTPAP